MDPSANTHRPYLKDPSTHSPTSWQPGPWGCKMMHVVTRKARHVVLIEGGADPYRQDAVGVRSYCVAKEWDGVLQQLVYMCLKTLLR